MPTNGFSTIQLKVKLLARKQKATELFWVGLEGKLEDMSVVHGGTQFLQKSRFVSMCFVGSEVFLTVAREREQETVPARNRFGYLFASLGLCFAY